MPGRVEGYLCLSLAMTLVGSTVIASKIIAAALPPLTATALRLAVALPIFLALMRLTGTAWPKPEGRDRILLLVQAAAGSVGYTAFLIIGLKWTSATEAGIVIGTLPVVAAAVSVLILGERPARSLLLAVALAGAGVLLITFRPGGGGGSLAGNLLVLGAVLCESLFILLSKRLRTAVSPLALSTAMTALGLAVAIVPAALEQPWTAPLTGASLGAVFYYALVPTFAGFLLWYRGLSRVSGTEASLFTAVAPISAVLSAAVFLGEPVGPREIIGIALVVAAIAGSALSLPPRKRRE